MRKPYFLQKSLPTLVKDYMDTHMEADIDLMTHYIIANHFEFRNKKKKILRQSVKSAFEWNVYLNKKELREAKDKASSIEEETPNKMKDGADKSFSDELQIMDDDDDEEEEESMNSSLHGKKQMAVDTVIESSIMKKKKNNATVSLLKFTPKLIPLKELRGIKSLMKSINLIMMEVMAGGIVTLMLTGPDKCGKTTLVDAMAAHMELPVYRIDLKDVLRGGPLASPLKRVQEELMRAHEAPSGIVHIHQLDLLYKRDAGSSSRQPEHRDVAVGLQNYIEGINSNKDESCGGPVMVIAETSRPECVELELRDCCHDTLVMAAPSATERMDILEYLCATSLAEGVDLAGVALKASSFVAGDLVQLKEKANTLAKKRTLSSGVESIDAFVEKKDGPFLLKAAKITMEDLISSAKLVTPTLKREGFPAIPDTTWDDIGGLGPVRERLRSCILDPIMYPEDNEKFGMKQSSGILLWGPPGCGKTLLAKAVANEAGVNLLIVNGPDLLSMYQGESERAVRTVFARAASVAPCVIFFDEFDSLCPRRSKTGSESGSKATIVNTLLTEMDGFLSRPGIYLMAATNLHDVLDPAVLRPGRFDTKLYVGPPDEAGRLAVLKAATKNGTLPLIASDVNLKEIAARVECTRFTGADCRHLVDTAILMAKEEKKQLMLTHGDVATVTQSTSDVTVVNGSKKRTLECDYKLPESKKLKIAGCASSNSVPDTLQEELKNSAKMAEVYPNGMYAVYKRHFLAALKVVKPSVSNKDLGIKAPIPEFN